MPNIPNVYERFLNSRLKNSKQAYYAFMPCESAPESILKFIVFVFQLSKYPNMPNMPNTPNMPNVDIFK